MKPLTLHQSDEITVELDEESHFVIITSDAPNTDPVSVWIPADRLPYVIDYLEACQSELNQRQEA